MAAKFIQIIGTKSGTEEWMFYCPGCQSAHHIRTVGERPLWTFDGNVEKPTVDPSIRVFPNTPSSRCHFFIRNGNIEFLDDCWHSLKGQTVEIPDWDTAWD